MNTEQPLALRLAERLDAETEKTVSIDLMHFEAAAELRRLHNVKLAFDEWIDKTSWVQHTAGASDLGKHRADVLRERIERLEAENEALREFVEYIRRTGDTRLASMAIAALARAGEVK
jgi:ABC-type phosphate transport system auxiliary subunit